MVQDEEKKRDRMKDLENEKTGQEAPQDLPPCQIYIDKEGKWFHKGAKIINSGIIQLFYANMEMENSGRYVIEWNGERCYVEVEDVPFVVRRVDRVQKSFLIHLSDETVEMLSPGTLTIGKENVLYCMVKKGRFSARFNRSSYYQIADYIEASGGLFYLPSGGRNHLIRTN